MSFEVSLLCQTFMQLFFILIENLKKIIKSMNHYFKISISNNNQRSYHHSPYRYVRNNHDDITKNADIMKTNDVVKEKAILTPKWNLQINTQAQQADCRANPSRSSPAVARKLSATAQSVLGGVKSFLMPASQPSFNNNSHASGTPSNSGIDLS